ncbi:MAG TPA: diguanylate cyclase, partial [Candidatus Limnocylindria bacterium]|nr:diguanylate cyclase [Candidatus Limnocylindria bacterium]
MGPQRGPVPGSGDGLLIEAERVSATGSFECGLQTRQVTFSSGFRRIFAAPQGHELSRDALLDRIHPDDRALVDQAVHRAGHDGEPFSFEVRIFRFDGVERTIHARGMALASGEDQAERVVGTVQDVTDEAAARSARDLLSYVVDSSDDAILTKTADGTITSWNRGAERLYGFTAEEAVGASISIIEPEHRRGEQAAILRRVFAGESIDHLETERMRKDGTALVVSLTISPVRDAQGRIVSAAVIARDVTARVGYEQQLRHLADHDQLTGLLNRRRLEEELKRELARVGRFGTPGALISLDVDNFKQINDSAGHAAGDSVLVEVAGVLSQRFRSTDAVARLGGDEFAVLLAGVSGEAAQVAAEKLREAIAAAAPAFGGKPLPITASIGVAPFDSDDVTADELLVNADLAMYAAKEAGRNRVVVYSPTRARRARSMARRPWSDRIREALEQDSF